MPIHNCEKIAGSEHQGPSGGVIQDNNQKTLMAGRFIINQDLVGTFFPGEANNFQYHRLENAILQPEKGTAWMITHLKPCTTDGDFHYHFEC